MSHPQTYANHPRYYPLWHYFAFPVLAGNAIVALVALVRHPTLHEGWWLLVSLALVAAVFASRIMALTVQNRVVRLEMQLRLARVLPPDLQAAIPRLSLQQLIALRFASDEETPELVRRVAEGSLAAPDDLKRAIRRWQPDTLRA